MKLPYKYEYDGEEITDFTVKALSAADLADARKAGKSGGSYSAMRRIAEGCLASLNGENDPKKLRNMVQAMPFFSLYAVVIYGGAETKKVDRIDGVYTCPKCKAQRHYGKTDDDDLSDRLEDMLRPPSDAMGIDFSLDKPIEIKRADTGAILESISEVSMRYPTVSDYVRGEGRYPDDDLRLMYYAYGCSVVAVNGKPVDASWRGKFGEMIFNRMDAVTINRVSSMLSDNAMGIQMERQCMSCHHVWKADLDMSNFFDFGQ